MRRSVSGRRSENPLPRSGLERGRPGLSALRAAERSMSAFGRGRRRCLLLAGAVGAVAAAFAANPACSGAPAAEPDRGGGIPLLSPEARASFGPIANLSPLIAALNAAPAPREDALRPGLLAEPKFDVSAVAATAPGGAAAEPKAPPAPESGFAAAT